MADEEVEGEGDGAPAAGDNGLTPELWRRLLEADGFYED